jgi:hypothetical protein
MVRSAGWRDASGVQDGLGSVSGLEFVEDVGDVVLHGFEGNAEGAGDVPVAGAVG